MLAHGTYAWTSIAISVFLFVKASLHEHSVAMVRLPRSHAIFVNGACMMLVEDEMHHGIA